MKVQILSIESEEKYEKFLLSRLDTLIYASIKYRNFLSKIFEDAVPFYLVALEKDEIVGALPAFLKKTPKQGCVLNSLPFYGSNGGIIVDPNVSEKYSVKKELMYAFNHLADQYNVSASTIITSPFDTDLEIYNNESKYTHLDQRIGSITHLPRLKDEDLKVKLMSKFHQKTRNLIRKGIENNYYIRDSDEEKDLEWLYDVHVDNMKTIGGLAKPKLAFETIRDTFSYGKDYKLYIAEKNGVYAAGLLLLYYNQSVEYFTPVLLKEYRETQVLSSIIYKAMLDAIQQGYVYWNWGGTWLSQTSVHHFKKRWGSMDSPYYYYTRVRDPSFLDNDRNTLLQHFRYFYLFPWSRSIEK